MYFTTQGAAIAAGRPADAVGLARFVTDGNTRVYQWVDEVDLDEFAVYDEEYTLLLAD